ncbi:hypothetical protein ACOHX3_000011 [Yersinia enterocolitica]|uniref:hypothetical protein n=1 Tax=Yersinia enterocolitica TaxID=630 RepID=UPI002AC52A48|nr:hypothetical protein [Yersinia enterocolitica]EKN4745108.1 hypothetical protein [Yersinia enterocolitica]HEN3547582.1 hypothetical protein [Yersinia enterocolitica]
MNNIEGLSKPVGFVGLKNIISLAEGNLGVISPNAAFGEEPVYSKEYVNLLMSELEAAEAALSAANEKLKDYQVPVGLIKRKTPLLSDGAFRYSFISDVNLPFDTELFTAPKKLSDLPYYIVFNAIAKATNIQGQAISISVKEFKAAIKAASFTVEGNADA